MKQRANSRRSGAGIAVGAKAITAAVLAGKTVHTVEVSVPGGSEGATPAILAQAMRDLRDRLIALAGAKAAGRPVGIALLPPLVETRLIDLPPLRRGEAAAIVGRDPRRYFLSGSADDRVLGAADRPNGRSGDVLAASASASLVDSVRAAAISAGWRVERIVPATGAWVAAARATGARTYAIALEGTLHVLQLDQEGQSKSLRRFPQGQAGDAAPLLAEGPALVVTENATLRAELASGPSQLEPPTFDAKALTALHAAAAEPQLVTAAARLEQRERTRRSAARLALAAVLMLVAAGALELWGVQRELDQIAARREAIRISVPGLLELRDSLLAVEEQRTAIRELTTSAPTLTAALLNVALVLPGDTYLTSFHSVGDSVTIEAVGSRAVDGLEALRRAPTLRNVRLQGTVTRELREGSTAVERFTVLAEVVDTETDIDPDLLGGISRPEDGMTVRQPGRGVR